MNSLKPRKNGRPQEGYISISLAVPVEILDQVVRDREDFFKYEFVAELTEKGILYRPVKINRREGW